MSVKRKRPSAIFSTTDFYGNLVTLAEETWVNHILDGHPDMMGCESLVESVIKSPYEVFRSTQSNTAAAFASAAGIGPAPEGLRALVDFGSTAFEKGSTTGFVMTAYPIDTVNYPLPRLGKRIYKSGGRT